MKDRAGRQGKEDNKEIMQPQAPAKPSGPVSLMAEAKSLGWKYWLRVIIGLLVVIFFAAWVPNAYLQYKYSAVFAESPCKLCLNLNNATAPCFPSYAWLPTGWEKYGAVKTTWLTLHPIKELGFKAHWLRTPCDVCGEIVQGQTQVCLNQTFAPVRTLNKNKQINFSDFNISP